MNQNRSVATIDAPDFINLKPDALNPGISKCEIKVLYLGANRNGSYIDKNTAIQMANSLPGCPIVGAYLEKKEDFGDHGHVMTIEDGEVHFSCKTVPYGFVDPLAKVWFQNFIDIDEFGNETEREYLMTTGFLWTEQYKEAQSIIAEGKGQSMELDEETLDGHWATNSKTGMEFFIINDAVFTKLCILGDDVEPCFEGASVTEPTIEKTFSYGKDFSKTLFTMMHELKEVLQDKGGSDMPMPKQQDEKLVEKEQLVSDAEFACKADTASGEFANSKKKEEEEDASKPEEKEGTSKSEEKEEKENASKSDEKEETPKSDEKEEASDSKDTSEPEEKKSEKQDEKAVEEEEDKKKKVAKNSLEDSEFAMLQEELKELREFKHEIENQRKDALINKYHMLSAEDKAEVIAHKEEYSLSEIESKLALIYVNKNVDFSTITGEKEPESDEVSTIFSLNGGSSAGCAPDFVEALRLAKEIN